MNVRFHTHAGGETGYGYHAREFWNRLSKHVDGKGKPINIVLDTTNHFIFYKDYVGFNIAYNVWESTRQPDAFFKRLLEFDQLWVPTEWQRRCSIEQGYPPDRVKVVPEGVDGSIFYPLSATEKVELPEHVPGRLVFLLMGRWEDRKFTKETIQAFLSTFSPDENVCMVANVDNPFPVDRYGSTEERLAAHGLNDPRIIIKHFLPRNFYIDYIRKGHIFIGCARAEGWNLPLIEALAAGTPSLYSNYGAHVEFAKDGGGIPVDILEMRKPVNVYNMPDAPGLWSEPDIEDLKRKMRYAYENYKELKRAAVEKSSFLRQKWTWDAAVEKALGILKEIDVPLAVTTGGTRLNLGSTYVSGYTNIDPYSDSADKKMEYSWLSYDDCSVDEIRADYVLQKVDRGKVLPTLREWARVLKPSGVLKLFVPDLESCIKAWLSAPHEARWNTYLSALFGTQVSEGEYHKTGFDERIIVELLKEAGFTQTLINRISMGIAELEGLQVEAFKSATEEVKSVPIKEDEIFVIGTWPDTDEKKKTLSERIGYLKAQGYPVLLVTHYPIPQDIQDQVDYYVYDKRNILSGDWRLAYWRDVDGVRQIKLADNEYHAVACIDNIRNAARFLRAEGVYKTMHYMEYDLEFNLGVYLETAAPLVGKHDFISLPYSSNTLDTGEGGVRTDLFTANIEWLSSVMPKFSSWKEYEEYESRGYSLILEAWFRKYLQEKGLYDDHVFLLEDNSVTVHNKYDQIERDVWRNIPENAPQVINYFVDGAFFAIQSKEKFTCNVEFIDRDSEDVKFRTELTSQNDIQTWARTSHKYFVNWKIKAYNDQGFIYEHNIDLKGKRVYVGFDSKALGDNLAWMPYLEEFRKKHDCLLIATTFWNSLFQKVYPEITFVEPGVSVENLYAMYRVGCYDNDRFKNKYNWRLIPMQRIATDCLGLEFEELRPKLDLTGINPSSYETKYVCIAEHSTMQPKYWNNKGAWQTMVELLRGKGYEVVVISREDTELKNVIKQTGNPIEKTIANLLGSEFFVGMGSGLSWLSWALGKKTVLISGFSEPFTEFQTDIVRIVPPLGKCRGCFNDPSLKFERGWDWCPRGNNYECTRYITPETVMQAITSEGLLNKG